MFGKNKGKSIDDMTTEEIEKYLESRKASEQSDQTLKDRVDESVAMDEKDTGTEDGQTASDRVDEALGKDVAADKTEDESEPDEADDADDAEPATDGTEESEPAAAQAAEQGDSATPDDGWRSSIEQKLDAIKAELDGIRRAPQAVDDKTADKLTALENKFN